jgi:hypothetical protein
MGYKFQFITLAGFHSLNYSHVRPGLRLCPQQHERLRRTAEKEFAAAERGFTAVKHQREVGTGYFDAVTTTIEAQRLDRGAEGLDRRRAVLRRQDHAPDGSQREFPGPVTVAEVAASIGAGLAKAALAARSTARWWTPAT